jgi:D-glycero-D-manno-heptose 1,7-bisphosphate phosphatase
MRDNNIPQKKVIFLDRDGIVNKDTNYLCKISDFQFTLGIIDVCLYLLRLDYHLIIITNQSGIARGYYNTEDYIKLTKWMLEQFNKQDVRILDVFYCPHGPDSNCNCRKPKPGMLIEANNKYNINFKESWMIGDRESDILAAKSAGIEQTVLITSNQEDRQSKATYILESITEVRSIITI